MKGWHGNSHKHSLASRGIQTKQQYYLSRGEEKLEINGLSLSRDFEKHKETIHEWAFDEELSKDESSENASIKIELMEYKEYDKLKDVRLLEHNGNLVGFIEYRDYFPDDDKKVIYLEEIFIHPDFRKTGLGVTALRLAFGESGAGRMRGNSLHQSVEFWRKLGAYVNPIEVQGKRTFVVDYN